MVFKTDITFDLCSRALERLMDSGIISRNGFELTTDILIEMCKELGLSTKHVRSRCRNIEKVRKFIQHHPVSKLLEAIVWSCKITTFNFRIF